MKSFYPKSRELSQAELRVLALVAQAMTDKEIALALHLSPDTIRKEAQNIRNKIGADNRVGMTLYALRNGLVEL